MKLQHVETKQQLEDAFHVRMKVFVEEQQVPEDEEIDQYEEAAEHFVLYDGSEPAAAGRFRILEGKGKVERICVMPSYRKSGAGTQIMDAIEQYGLSKGIHTFKLNAQIQAIPFYEKRGYHISSQEFLDAGIPHKAMIKEI